MSPSERSGPSRKIRVSQVSLSRPGKPACWNRFIGPAIILLAAALAVAPQLLRGNSCGHDFDFHLVSWLDAQNSWHNGLFYPHWAPSANFGAGEPRFVFYPPLTWMLGAALGFVLPRALVPVALTFLLLAATGLATRALARQALADAPSTLAGCVALFSGYALFTAYERSAFGELTGGFWIPLLLLLILRNRSPAGSGMRRALDGSTVLLALVVAGAWLSNAPLGVMACYLLAAVALLLGLIDKSWAPVLRAAVGAAVGMGLAAIYLFPAAWEQRWADIRQVTEDPGEMIENSWLFGHHADPALQLHDVELHRVSLLAVIMIAVAVVGLLISWRRGSVAANRRWWVALAPIPFAILFLQFPASLPVWNLLPKLRFLQFPWRWLVVLGAPMAIFLASAIWFTGRWRRIAVVTVMTAAFVAATVAAGTYYFQACYEEDAVQGMLGVYRTGAGFAGTDEYAPPGSDSSLLASGLPDACLVSNPLAVLGKAGEDQFPTWSPDQGSCEATFSAAPESWRVRPEHLRVVTATAHSGYLILRRRSYPAWQVKVNGRVLRDLPQREDGLMAVPVPQGSVDLTVDWTATPDVIVGRWLSGLAVLLLTALCLLERRLQRPWRTRL